MIKFYEKFTDKNNKMDILFLLNIHEKYILKKNYMFSSYIINHTIIIKNPILFEKYGILKWFLKLM